jgi:hypothetical protein
MVPIYRDEEITQNDMIDKIKSSIFNSDLILSITIMLIYSHNITIYSNTYLLIPFNSNVEQPFVD